MITRVYTKSSKVHDSNQIKMKMLMIVVLIAMGSGTEDGVNTSSRNCTAEYMDSLLKQALQIKEQCNLTGRYDCCKV